MREAKPDRHRPLTVIVSLLLAMVVSLSVVACGSEDKDADVDVGRPLPLRPSSNGHFLVTEDGKPFVMQADTAWWLAERSMRDDVITYLDKRREQGFNVVMVAATFAKDEAVNVYGQKIWTDDASTPNPVFFEHIDYLIDQAEARDMRIALLPAWLRHVTPPEGSGLTVDNAYGYGRWIGERYRDRNLIWVLGGDDADWEEDITRELARGVTEGVTGSETDHEGVTMTYHPVSTSMDKFHDDDWLTFNMAQTGHCGDLLASGHVRTAAGFERSPAKPIIDAEPYYEGHPLCWKPEQGYATAQEVRNGLYNGVFGGGAGIAYGHHSVWQMHQPDRRPINGPLSNWYDALDDEVAGQVQYLRKLLESRPILTRVPDGGTGTGTAGTRYTRSYDDGFIMGYSAGGQPLDVDLGSLSGDQAQIWWFDPRTGVATDAGIHESIGTMTNVAPSQQDWVLVVDDASRGFPAPGAPFES